MRKKFDFVQRCIDEFKKEYGENARLEEGEVFATVFNDAIVLISLEEKTLKIRIFRGKPYFIHENIDITSE